MKIVVFINKGLLQSDRSISGHSSFYTPFSFNRESLCFEVSPYHVSYPRSPATLDWRGFFITYQLLYMTKKGSHEG